MRATTARSRWACRATRCAGLTTDGQADLKKALSATRELGLHHWEAFPAHVPMTDDRARIQAIKDEIEAAGVHVSGYGVVHLGKDEAADRKIFEFAKACKVGYLSVDPDPRASTCWTSWSRNTTSRSASTTTGPGTSTP